MATLKAQGTSLWFIDPDAPTTPVEVACITSFSGLTASRDQTEVTCLQDPARRYEAGMANPGTATFGINFDPASASHKRLHELYVAGTSVPWALGASDGTAPPTITAGDFVLPTSRTWWTFDGYVSDFPFDFAIGGRVASTLGVQLSGFPEVVAKTP